MFLDEKQNGKIQELLQSLKTSSIKKKYAGGWGFTGGNVITIRYYAHNDNNNAFCEISISNGIIPENISDKYLLNILEKEVEKVEDEELKNETGTIFYYVIEDLRKDNFLDKYFN